MKKDDKDPLYKALGARIKYLREQWQQTLSEVSGTLEIEESSLKAIEAGKILPSPAHLDMLINHFLLTDEQAQNLRNLAQGQQDVNSEALISGVEDMLMKQIVMYLPIDNKILYTDTMHATVNNHGVVIQFMQQVGQGQPVVVSKVGMSRKHAEKVIEVLQNTLKQHDQGKQQKKLPSPKDRTSNDRT